MQMKKKKIVLHWHRSMISILLVLVFSIVTLIPVLPISIKAASYGVEGSDGQLHDTFYITGSVTNPDYGSDSTSEVCIYSDSSKTVEIFYIKYSMIYDEGNFWGASYNIRYYNNGKTLERKLSDTSAKTQAKSDYSSLNNIKKYGYYNKKISLNELRECGMLYYLNLTGCRTVFENPECNGVWGGYGDSHADVLVSLDVSVKSLISETSKGDIQDENSRYLSYTMTLTSPSGDILFRSKIGFDRQEVPSASDDYAVLFGYEIYNKPVGVGTSAKTGYYNFDFYTGSVSTMRTKQGYIGDLEDITTGIVKTKNNISVDLDTYYAIFQEFGLAYRTVSSMKGIINTDRSYGSVNNVLYTLTNNCNIIKFINGLNAGVTLSVPVTNGTYSFQTNGAIGSAPSGILGDGTTTAPSCSATKAGYTFAGWAASSTATTATYKVGATLPEISSDVTLYAVWTVNQYNIIYNSNGGSGTMATSAIPYTGAALRNNSFTRTGYTFAGWSTTSNGSVQYSDGATITPASDLTLYAVWTVNQYQITYHANGGSGNMTVSMIPYTGATLRKNSFAKTGHTFAGWSTSSGGNVMYGDEATISPTSNMTLYAVWNVNKHAVTLLNTGDGASSSSSSVNYGSTVTIKAGTKKGYTFDGWTVKSGGVTLVNAKNTTTTFTMPNADVTVEADWKINQYTVTVVDGADGSSGSGTYNYNSTVTLNAGNKIGYTFNGWTVTSGTTTLANASSSSTTFQLPASDITVKAIWKVNSYAVTVTNGGNGATTSQNVAYSTTAVINAGSKDKHYFCGWEVVNGNVTLADKTNAKTSFTMPASAVVLNATWKNITRMEAKLNSNFSNTYTNSTYYKNGEYNVNKNVSVTKNMVDVTIKFSDGTVTKALNDDFILGNHEVIYVGTNNIEITLTAGNSGLTYTIPLVGYSPELDAVMEELDLAKNDYAGLAAKVQEMQTQINELTADVSKYEQNLAAIKNILAQADIDTNLKDELQKRLENTQNSVKEAVERLNGAEAELSRLENVISDIMNLLGVDNEQYKDYENLSDILKELQNKIEQMKKNETKLIEEINQIADKLEIGENISNEDDLQNSTIFEKIKEKIDSMKEQLDSYKDAMDQIKDTLGIVNTGSLESQLDEIVTKIQQIIENLENLKNELDRILEGLEGDNSELDTDGMTQIEAIIAQINALKEYANSLKQFHDSLKGLLGLDSDSTNEDIYQTISDMKDKIAEYDRFLDETEELIRPEGVNGSNTLVTGVQTREELEKVSAKIADMVKQIELLKETLQVLLEKEDISVENAEELQQLLEQVMNQKERADQFLAKLKEILGLDNNAGYGDVIQAVTNMKETLAEYWEYLGDVEELIRIPNGSGADSSVIVTGPAVTVRLSNIYDKLDDMMKQQDTMAETIKILLQKEDISTDNAKELKELLDEIIRQKEQADRFLAELKKLLDLNEDAEYQDVISTVSDMKDRLNSYIEIIEDLMRQLGMTNEDGEKENLQNRLKDILNKVLDIMNQLEEQIKRTEEADKKISLLEKTIERLTIEKQLFDTKNSSLRKEIEELNRKLSFAESENSSLKKKNKGQQEKIEELERRLQSQAEETESLLSEKKHLLENISDKDRQIEELKKQIESLSIQLAEKEGTITGLEMIIKNQKPIQDLLEQNKINYEKLVLLINKENAQNVQTVKETIPVTKIETEKESAFVKESISVKETTSARETLSAKETSSAKETTSVKEAVASKENTSGNKTASARDDITAEKENSESLTEVTSETEVTGEDVQREERQRNSGFRWILVLIIIVIILILIGGILYILNRKKNRKK